MKLIILLLTTSLILGGCATSNPTKENIQTCKSACRGKVQHYSDDIVECTCKQQK